MIGLNTAFDLEEKYRKALIESNILSVSLNPVMQVSQIVRMFIESCIAKSFLYTYIFYFFSNARLPPFKYRKHELL